MKIIVLMGPPCSGKSMIGHFIENDNGFEYISSGDIARSMANGDKHEIESLNAGNMAPEQEMRDRILQRIKECRLSGKSCVLDGFPRTVLQYVWLREVTVCEDDVSFIRVRMNWKDIKQLCDKRNRSDKDSIEKRYNHYMHYTYPISAKATLDGYTVYPVVNDIYNDKFTLTQVAGIMDRILGRR